jgi:predicted nucleic acid-binding protein
LILVDSSVWIDYFNGKNTPQTDKLDDLLGRELVGLGDLVLTEVLQGFADDNEFNKVKHLLTSMTVVPLAGQEIAIKAAVNYRTLRKQGLTIRKTIDCIIATCCIERGHTLLHNDRDFEPFVKHLGLREA